MFLIWQLTERLGRLKAWFLKSLFIGFPYDSFPTFHKRTTMHDVEAQLGGRDGKHGPPAAVFWDAERVKGRWRVWKCDFRRSDWNFYECSTLLLLRYHTLSLYVMLVSWNSAIQCRKWRLTAHVEQISKVCLTSSQSKTRINLIPGTLFRKTP